MFQQGWTIGDTENNNDQFNFIRLLSKSYNKCYNFSSTGASISGYLNQLYQFNKIYDPNREYVLLVMLTQHKRDYIFNNETGWTNIYPKIVQNGNIIEKISNEWYNNVTYPQTGHLNWYRTISIIQGYCQNKSNIEYHFIEQFNESPYLKNLEFLINRKKVYTTPIIKEIFFKEGKNSEHTLD